MTQHEPYAVLFLCTGNSARSLMAECALRRWGRDRFLSFSAGSDPKPAPHPETVALLESLRYDVSHLRSKSWNEFVWPNVQRLDFVFTVCDRARNEPCPSWPGQPMTAHWGVEDPAAFRGTPEQVRRFFHRIYLELESRIKIFTQLPFEELDRLSLQERVERIGKSSPAPDEVEP